MNLTIQGGTGAENRSAYISGLCLSLVLALITYRIFYFQVSGFVEYSTNAAFGVTVGVPDWRVNQSRVLGPYIVLFFSKLGPSYQASMMIYTFLITVLNVAVIYHLVHRITASARQSLFWAMLFCLMLLFLQQDVFFIWDSLDLLLFSVFCYLIFYAPNLKYLVPLFIVSIFNRESGLFIALFIVLDSFDFSRLTAFRLYLVDKSRFASGIGLMVVGLAYTKLSRDILFIDNIGRTGGAKNALIGNHIQFRLNARDILIDNWLDENILHNMLILIGFAFLLIKFVKFDRRAQKVTIFAFLLMLNITIFGIFNETRVLLPLVPLFIFFWLYESRTASMAGRGGQIE